MRLSISTTAILLSMVLLSGNPLYSSVEFNIYPNGSILGPAMDFAEIGDSEDQIKEHPESLIDNNEKVIPYGLALANTLGYPNGKSIIPNFEAGIAAGAAVYQYDRAGNFSKDDPKIPGIGANAAFHFGLGLTADTDISFKFLINKGMYSPDKAIKKETDERMYDVTLEETDIVSFGLKGRYNLIKEITVIPFIFSFGGVTAGVAVDYTHGKISSKGIYQDTRLLEFEGVDSFSGDSFTQEVNVKTSVEGEAAIEWNMISVTPEIMGYVDLFYIFSIYTGPALTLNAGSANLSMTANGELTNLTPVYSDDGHITELVGVNETVATGALNANAPLSVPIAVPLWKAGIELNILAFKLQAEAAVVLTDPAKSFTAQVGARVQF